MKKNDLFGQLNSILLANFESFLREWLSGGKLSGAEYSALNPTRADSHAGSFQINVHKGCWQDFATGDKGGDPVSLYAYLYHSNDQGAAARELEKILGMNPIKTAKSPPKKPRSSWFSIEPPEDTPQIPNAHSHRGWPEKVWAYRSSTGKPLGYIFKFKTSDGGKEFTPLSWCKNRETGAEEWRWMAFPEPRWLYGLERLAKYPKNTVILVEGEKCADIADQELIELIGMTWPGGSKAVDKIDWTPLSGRKVIIWPDCDSQIDKNGVLLPADMQPGQMAAHKIAAKLMALDCQIWMMDIPAPGEKPSGWDIADAVDEGLTGEKLADYVRVHAHRVLAAEIKNKPENQQSSKKTRRDYDELIGATDDFDILTGELLITIARSGLLAPAREYLIAKIAKKAGVAKSALQEFINDIDKDGNNKIPEDQDGRIDELNQKHAIIPMGGRILILNRDYDPVMDRQLLTFSMKQDFETRYCNRKVFDKGEEIGLGTYWLHHPRRAEFEGMVFSPGLDQPGYLNLWTGWGAKPKAGSCKNYLEFVLDVICSGDQSLYDYIIYWCAHLLQRPQELPETALVFRGREGIGKNTFIEPLSLIIGREHYLMLSSLNQITGRFSGHLANALLIFCNESVWGGDKSAQGVLKSMITDDVQPIEHKGRDLIMVKSYRRMIFATNENWAVPRGADDRRYIITDVSDSHKGDFNYFNTIREEMKNGGTSALMAYLLKWDLNGWHPRNIPAKLQECGWELKIRSGGSIVQWWFDILQHGWLEKLDDYYAESERLVWPARCLKEVMQKSYLNWCLNYKILHPEHSVVVGRQLHDWGIISCRPWKDNPNRNYYYKLPPLHEAQANFSKRFSIPVGVWVPDEECDM